MNILIVHNYYTIPGGEDTVVHNEINMLKKHGHNVFTYFKRNKKLNTNGIKNKIKAFKNTIFNKSIRKEIQQLIKEKNIDIVHCHNTFPQISPSIYKYAKECGCKVFQTIHNFRFLCANAQLLKNNEVCTKCVNHNKANAIKNKCYHDSFFQSFTWYLMIKKLSKRKLYDYVDYFICLTDFNKVLLSNFIPIKKIVVKPNFSNFIPNRGKVQLELNKEYFMFVGRLDKSKGIDKLIDYFEKAKISNLIVCGDGPLMKDLKNKKLKHVILNGLCNKDKIISLYKKAYALIVPSVWYEGFPMTILEAFSQGVPVVVNEIGNLTNIVQNNYNGMIYKFNDYNDLNTIINKLMGDSSFLSRLSNNAIYTATTKYSENENYKKLLSIYSLAIGD